MKIDHSGSPCVNLCYTFLIKSIIAAFVVLFALTLFSAMQFIFPCIPHSISLMFHYYLVDLSAEYLIATCFFDKPCTPFESYIRLLLRCI